MVFELKPEDEWIHETDQFKKLAVSCECGYVHGRQNLGKKCRRCKEKCRVRDRAWSYYKGYVNDPRIRGERPLNRRERRFFNLFMYNYERNNAVKDNIAQIPILKNNINSIVSQVITNCSYLDIRIIWPNLYTIDSAKAEFYIKSYVDYLIEGVFWPENGEATRDYTYPGCIEDIVDGLSLSFDATLSNYMIEMGLEG